MGLWTRLRFLFSQSSNVRSRNTRATRLTVVSFSSESACSYSDMTPLSSARPSRLKMKPSSGQMNDGVRMVRASYLARPTAICWPADDSDINYPRSTHALFLTARSRSLSLSSAGVVKRCDRRIMHSSRGNWRCETWICRTSLHGWKLREKLVWKAEVWKSVSK